MNDIKDIVGDDPDTDFEKLCREALAIPEIRGYYNKHHAKRMAKQMKTTHPGEILREEYLKPLAMTYSQFAKALDIPSYQVAGILAGRWAITADIALRLAKAFDSSPKFWLNLQQRFDLHNAKRKLGDKLNAIKPISWQPELIHDSTCQCAECSHDEELDNA